MGVRSCTMVLVFAVLGLRTSNSESRLTFPSLIVTPAPVKSVNLSPLLGILIKRRTLAAETTSGGLQR
jgi:hypothetical protein